MPMIPSKCYSKLKSATIERVHYNDHGFLQGSAVAETMLDGLIIYYIVEIFLYCMSAKNYRN